MDIGRWFGEWGNGTVTNSRHARIDPDGSGGEGESVREQRELWQVAGDGEADAGGSEGDTELKGLSVSSATTGADYFITINRSGKGEELF